MSEELSQSEIVAGLRQGSREAWDALCRNYDDRLWGHVSRLIGSDAAAVADCYQETLMAVARAGSTIEPDTRLWAWLAGIAHKQAALHWRKHYRRKDQLGVPVDLVAPRDLEPTALLAQAEQIAAVRRLLADMQADHVALLTAKYMDDMSVSDMVTHFGGTTEAVRSRLARARRDFRSRYQRMVDKEEVGHRQSTTNDPPRQGG